MHAGPLDGPVAGPGCPTRAPLLHAVLALDRLTFKTQTHTVTQSQLEQITNLCQSSAQAEQVAQQH
jgi:hypothetical protein